MTARVLLLVENEEGRALLAHAQEMLARFGVEHELRLVDNQVTISGEVVIVANSTVPALSARAAAMTDRPVLAVPLQSLEQLQTSADGSGALCLAIGKAGAINAALLAVAILANGDAGLREKLEAFRREQTATVIADRLD